MIYNYRNRNILELPFDDKGFLDEPSTLEALKVNSSWIIPQALEQIVKHFTLVRGINGLIDPKSTLAKFAERHPDKLNWYRFLFSFLNVIPRGSILSEPQNKCPEYSALVPLILSAFKKYRKVSYSEWDWENSYIKVFVDVDLYDAVTKGKQASISGEMKHIDLTREQRIDARDYCLVIRSGVRAGNIKKPTQQYSITNRAFGKEMELNLLPKLRKIMECQVWVAHPSLRSELMILDVKNLDSMPEPLEQEEFKITTLQQIPEEELSWS